MARSGFPVYSISPVFARCSAGWKTSEKLCFAPRAELVVRTPLHAPALRHAHAPLRQPSADILQDPVASAHYCPWVTSPKSMASGATKSGSLSVIVIRTSADADTPASDCTA